MAHAVNDQRLEIRSPSTAAPRVLVVDDEPAIGTTLRLVLEDRYVVDSVTSVSAALRHVASSAVDVILCDLALPHAGGYELHAELVRARAPLARKIVFMTGGNVSDRRRIVMGDVELPMLQKPFDVASLTDAIEALLRREPAAA